MKVFIEQVDTYRKTGLAVTLSAKLCGNLRDLLQEVEHKVVAVLLLEKLGERRCVCLIFNIAKHVV